MNSPWENAEIHEGIAPEQRTLFPRPVVLECQECRIAAYWYPAENRIDVYSRLHRQEYPGGWTSGHHDFAVYSWNGNEAQEGPISD